MFPLIISLLERGLGPPSIYHYHLSTAFAIPRKLMLRENPDGLLIPERETQNQSIQTAYRISLYNIILQPLWVLFFTWNCPCVQFVMMVRWISVYCYVCFQLLLRVMFLTWTSILLILHTPFNKATHLDHFSHMCPLFFISL